MTAEAAHTVHRLQTKYIRCLRRLVQRLCILRFLSRLSGRKQCYMRSRRKHSHAGKAHTRRSTTTHHPAHKMSPRLQLGLTPMCLPDSPRCGPVSVHSLRRIRQYQSNALIEHVQRHRRDEMNSQVSCPQTMTSQLRVFLVSRRYHESVRPRTTRLPSAIPLAFSSPRLPGAPSTRPVRSRTRTV